MRRYPGAASPDRPLLDLSRLRPFVFPLGDDAIASRLFSLGRLGAIPYPFPLSMGELSDSMRRNVERMGEHFLLTSREMDVLTLYALGHTQKKVAEELFITPATAHSHIKRIYSKCGMHSRQEILEYLNSYGS